MKSLITRADDAGSSRAANEAIREAADAGFIKNVSVMACGPYLEDAAKLLAHKKNICFGLHACINSEWDRLIWGPVAPKEKVPCLVDHRGAFYQSQEDYRRKPFDAEQAITEYRYQLERVREAGFHIRYVDSHMFPELYVSGLGEAMDRFIESEHLIHHKWFNRILPGNDIFPRREGAFERAVSRMDGQYLLVMHPAKYGAEMCMAGNASVSGKTVAIGREQDYRFVMNEENTDLCSKYGVKLLRYDEAVITDTYCEMRLEDFQNEEL